MKDREGLKPTIPWNHAQHQPGGRSLCLGCRGRRVWAMGGISNQGCSLSARRYPEWLNINFLSVLYLFNIINKYAINIVGKQRAVVDIL